MFDSCSEVWGLMVAFRSGRHLAEFRHRHHLALALCYASLYPEGADVETFRDDLLRHLAPLGHQRKYHETITRFWFDLARHFLDVEGSGRCMCDVANAFIDRFADKTMIERHYDREVLYSEAARVRSQPPKILIATKMGRP